MTLRRLPDRCSWPPGKRATLLFIFAFAAEEGLAALGQEGEAGEVCDGYDEEWAQCSGLPPCHVCRPVDCKFGAWSDWYSEGGCTGVLSRHRGIFVPNNDCGRPCNGSKTDSKRWLAKECTPAQVDCQLTSWSEWTYCKGHSSQRYRTRGVEIRPEHGGKPCDGAMKQTTFCGYGPPAIPCQLSDWHDWSRCSASCGVGVKTRLRRILVPAQHGGTACQDTTSEARSCHANVCPDSDCVMGSWSDWSGCVGEQSHNNVPANVRFGEIGKSGSSDVQRYRHRRITKDASGSGRPCNESLRQTEPCPRQEPRACVLSRWSDWSSCDKSCDGGQSFRSRSVEQPSLHLGRCDADNLRETRACNMVPCVDTTPFDCRLSSWRSWSDCSATCGKGSSTRARTVLRTREPPHGRGCAGSLEELRVCRSEPCSMQDCKWSDWYDWSDCTFSCGGGTRFRSRAVVASPINGGRPCEPLIKSDAVACNTQPCTNDCVDGKWGEWLAWSSCSTTCGSGYRSRRRSVAQEASSCGTPVSGAQQEFAVCTSRNSCTKAVDCQLSAWGHWSDCSASCFGVRERNRLIEVFASGHGRPCNHTALKELAPCHPEPGNEPSVKCAGIGKRDCQLAPWSEWTRCTTTCGGGQRERSRRVDSPAANGGRGCQGQLAVTEVCYTQPCASQMCVDCSWGDWSAWGDCEPCELQRFRQRCVVQVQNHCGRPCERAGAREVSNCTSPRPCEKQSFCAWSEWSSTSGCTGHCGADVGLRSRVLGRSQVANLAQESFLFVASESSKCTGTQLGTGPCDDNVPCNACDPVDCIFDPWGDWSASSCTGLCERSRVVGQVNNQCGTPCVGALLETKACQVPSHCGMPKDCVLAPWRDWSECSEGSGQKTRSRYIEQHAAGGTACAGVLSETQGCDGVAIAFCRVSSWSDWSPCPITCGVGWQTRTRRIAEHAQGGGKPCTNSLEQFQPCEKHHCPDEDCALGEWSEWSSCGGAMQRFRDRDIVNHVQGSGKPCNDTTQETETCGLTMVDCLVSDWTAWDVCDVTCGGGQQQRHRTVSRYPENFGLPCPSQLVEMRGCATSPCFAVDCEVSAWTSWGVCSASCGVGQSRRGRQVLTERSVWGKPCEESLEEMQACEVGPCPRSDCQWRDWSAWSACTCSCDGGQRSRYRDIAKKPWGGGAFCHPETREEVQPCSTQPCQQTTCVDGKWGEWQPWSPCSRSCGGGLSFRTRGIVRMASDCGKPVAGKDREEAWCNVDVACESSKDCKFTDWGDWGDCSVTCNGVRARARQIGRFGRGDGRYCIGGLRQTVPCNPGVDETVPYGCTDAPRADCTLTDWSSWTACSATCGGGQHSRSRGVVQAPRNGGLCAGRGLVEVRECARQTCPGPGPRPVDCQFGPWEDWGACSKCGGQRKRFRSIRTYPSHGGKNCKSAEQEETSSCPRRCHQRRYCTWQDWQSWSACTAHCGQAKRSRRRYLKFSDVPADPPKALEETAAKYADSDMEDWLSDIPSPGELLIAFMCGCCVFFAAFAGLRGLSAISSRRRRGVQSSGPTPRTIVAPSLEEQMRTPLST